MANNKSNVQMCPNCEVHEASNQGMECCVCHPGGDIHRDMESGVQTTDIETLNYGGANQVCFALTKLINDVINQCSLAELYDVHVAVMEDCNVKGEFGIAKI